MSSWSNILAWLGLSTLKSGAKKGSLRHSLLRSHLNIALIGGFILLLALASLLWLRATALRAATQRGPTAQASASALGGLQRSLAGMRGWVALGDEFFREDRRRAWSEDVRPALNQLLTLSERWTDPRNNQRLVEVTTVLEDLEAVQWWIEDVARTPGNEPAQVAQLLSVWPVAEAVRVAITAMIDEESHHESGAERKFLLGLLANFRGAFLRCTASLSDLVVNGGSDHERHFRGCIDEASQYLAAISARMDLLSPGQQELLKRVEETFIDYGNFADHSITLRKSDRWNVAQYLLATQAIPLAQDATALLRAMSDSQLELMKRDAALVSNAGVVAIWLSLALIVTLMVSAGWVSRRGAERISRPIKTLSKATRELALGRLHKDIPVFGDDELGQLTESFNEMRDALQRGEKNLRDSEGRVRAIVEAASDGIVTLDEQGVIASFNPAAEQIFGYSEREAVGQSVGQMLPTPDIQAQIRQTSGTPFEAQGRRKDGTVYEMDVAVSAMHLDNMRMYTWIVRDITERKRAERILAKTAADLERKASDLERTNQDLDQFAYVASHDLKAPLRAIANLSQWIEEEIGDGFNDSTREQMDLLRGRVHRMEALIEGVLKYSRIGRVALEVEPVDVAELLAESIEFLAPPADFQIDIGPDMPTLEAARVPFSQVFANLISNAVKYHHRKDGKIDISVREEGDFYAFTVRDDGPGIGPEFHEKIFQIFQTLQARDDVESTGVGLSLVKKIVEDQGGEITLQSNVGEGAAFRFTWPKQPQQSE